MKSSKLFSEKNESSSCVCYRVAPDVDYVLISDRDRLGAV